MTTPLEKKTIITIFIGVAFLVVLALYVGLNGGSFAPASSTPPVPLGSPAYAPQGTLASGFPEGLVLGSTTQFSSSYAIHYASSTDQYTAEWNASDSIDSILRSYAHLLYSEGWKVTVNPITTSWIRSISGATSTATVLVTIVSQNGVSKVTITYAKQ